MPAFHFRLPVQVRYGDLDPQWHVNNARYLTFLEMARGAYLKHLGLWDGKSFFDLGIILGDLHIRYLSAVELGQQIGVDICVTRIGNKSFTFEYQIVDEQTGEVMATAESEMVSYDYHRRASRPVPEEWRAKMSAFEERDFSKLSPSQ